MKTLKYLFLVAACAMLAACEKTDWDEPTNGITYAELSGKLITISELKSMSAVKKAISTDYRDGTSFTEITDSLLIKGYVTANDVSGNIYKYVTIQDETGAIEVGVAQGGLFGYLPIGAEVLIDLRGLYVGNYRMQPKIGYPGTNTNNQKDQLNAMSWAMWVSHYALTGNKMSREEVDNRFMTVFADGKNKTSWDMDEDAGKLGILKNVTFKNGSYYDNNAGSTVTVTYNADSKYADPIGIGNSVSWYFKEQSTSVMLYNSNYSDFAAETLPQGKVNIRGIFVRYNKYWELIIRDLNDVEEVSE